MLSSYLTAQSISSILRCGYIVADIWPAEEESEPMADVALRSKGILKSSFLLLNPIIFPDWYSRVVVKIDMAKLLDTNHCGFQGIRDRINYVTHLQAHSIYVELPSERSKIILLAQVVNSALGEWSCPKMHFEVPVKIPSECRSKDFKDSWSQWNFFRSLIRNPANALSISLLIEDLPEEEEQKRWMGEKVKMIVLPLETFVSNAKGFPVLKLVHQRFIQNLFDAYKRISVAVKCNLDSPKLSFYVKYLSQMLDGKFIPEYDHNIDDSRDVLQVPLQPLKDNLQSGTYEIFEKDPIKYEEYRRAILAAIQDRPGKDML